MKTFKQFREASSENLPPIITDLKKMAGSYKMDKKQATNLKNTIVGTVFNKLGGQEGIDKAVGGLQPCAGTPGQDGVRPGRRRGAGQRSGGVLSD